jgi:hypothetical protein
VLVPATSNAPLTANASVNVLIAPQDALKRRFTRISSVAHGSVRTSLAGFRHTGGMNTTVMNRVKAFTLIALGLAVGALGVYAGEADDAPGGAVIGLVLMAAGIVLGVRAWRDRLPAWAAGAALIVGAAIASFFALVIQSAIATAPLYAQSLEVPSAMDMAPAPHYEAAVQRARSLVRAAVVEQTLPGVSVAVGAGGTIVWAEGFGWRDVGTWTLDTRAPVTPATRFHIGTAASVVAPAAVAPLGLTHTGVDEAAAWSPEHLGEPEDDFPPFAMIRHFILQPLGLAPAEYPLPGDRATFYVPRSGNDPRRGRRLMYMRDLACCANGMAFYSTPSDLVRFALAANPGALNGELAGGMVMSVLPVSDRGIVVAVTSNIAYANTSALAQQIGDAFAEPAR